LEYAYTYGDPRRLYLNVTNRCTNRCAFCIRYKTEGLGGAVLSGDGEPDLAMLQASVQSYGAIDNFNEFIWCGYGEPTFRLDLIKDSALWLRSCGAKVRLNTNGHACLIHGRDVLAELAQAVDRVSVSLNAPDARRYEELCRPDPSVFPNQADISETPEHCWDAMIDFLFRAPAFFENVQASVVGHVLTADENDRCRSLAHSLGIRQFRVR
jgi:TatD DNase family protein